MFKEDERGDSIGSSIAASTFRDNVGDATEDNGDVIEVWNLGRACHSNFASLARV